jgi:hypothetical protein
MVKVAKAVSQLTPEVRASVESLIGGPLADSQRIEIRVEGEPNGTANGHGVEWPWGDIYEGMSEAEIEECHELIMSSRNQHRTNR